jgi:arabinogalactan endo-1,4-beta-galactosidase
MELLSYYGINWVRIRLWNDPYTANGQPYGGGTNDYAKAVEIAQRAKKWGMKVLLDFHYSDFWAHPGQQSVPKAWRNSASNADNLAVLLKAYTKQVLSDMYAEGAMPDMVQVGNEINTGLCGWKESGNTRANEKKLLAAGLAAVREISAEYNYPIRTMLHATDGISTVDWYFGVMQNLDFDILGLSFYPMWHGNYTSFKNGLQSLANKYKKPIIVAEYSAAYTSQAGSPNGTNQYTSNADTQSFLSPGNTGRTIQGQASIIRNLNNAIMNNTVSNGVRYGIGAFWWEPAWLPLNGTAWANPASNEWYRMALPGYDSSKTGDPGNSPRVTWANQAFFSFTGTALPSLNAFLQMMDKPPRVAQ